MKIDQGDQSKIALVIGQARMQVDHAKRDCLLVQPLDGPKVIQARIVIARPLHHRSNPNKSNRTAGKKVQPSPRYRGKLG